MLLQGQGCCTKIKGFLFHTYLYSVSLLFILLVLICNYPSCHLFNFNFPVSIKFIGSKFISLSCGSTLARRFNFQIALRTNSIACLSHIPKAVRTVVKNRFHGIQRRFLFFCSDSPLRLKYMSLFLEYHIVQRLSTPATNCLYVANLTGHFFYRRSIGTYSIIRRVSHYPGFHFKMRLSSKLWVHYKFELNSIFYM